MSLAATIVFTGIVLIQQKGTGDLTAFLPEGSKPRMSMNAVPSQSKKFSIQPHAAYIKVKALQVSNSTTRHVDLRLVENNEVMNVYFLQKDERLEVQTDSTAPIQGSTTPNTGLGWQPFAAVLKSTELKWTAKLKAAAPLSKALAGRVVMKHGTIYAKDISKDWEFSQFPNKKIELPQSVLVDVPITLNQVDLVSSTTGKSIHLSDHPDPAHPISIEFGNGTLASILAVCPHIPPIGAVIPAICDEGEDDGFDFHYELYNEILDAYLDGGNPPIPHKPGSHHVTGSNCPPQRIDGP
ncbi:MAG: hypothetical protein ABI779_20435 [Acidobacteriota bacterium]